MVVIVKHPLSAAGCPLPLSQVWVPGYWWEQVSSSPRLGCARWEGWETAHRLGPETVSRGTDKRKLVDASPHSDPAPIKCGEWPE